MSWAPSFLRRGTWLWGLLAAFIVLTAIGALIWQDHRETARPALWRVSQGEHHGWLFGTIHVVPSGARWLSPLLEKAVAESDILVLEASGLAQERAGRGTFEALGRTPALLPVAQRLDGKDRERLAALVQASPTILRDLDNYESWAAALLISAAANGQAGTSVEAAGETILEQRFRDAGQPVRGLETVPEQLGLFDALSPAAQSALLKQAVRESDEAPTMVRTLYEAWARGDMTLIGAQFARSIDQLPELRTALVQRRNALWARRIDLLLREKGTVPFIAVGVGHLPGAEGLIAELTTRGWHVDRVQ